MEILQRLITQNKNPRTISSDNFEKLKKSIKDFPQMLEQRPIVFDENYQILGGNMRFLAVKDLIEQGFEVKENYFKQVTGWSEEQKRQFVIKDNIELGDWDMNILASDWADLPLDDWGVETLGIFGEEDNGEIERLDELKEKKKIKCPNCEYEFTN